MFAYTQYETDDMPDAVFCSERCVGHAIEKSVESPCARGRACACKRARTCYVCGTTATTTRSVGEVCAACALAFDNNDVKTLIVRGGLP